MKEQLQVRTIPEANGVAPKVYYTNVNDGLFTMWQNMLSGDFRRSLDIVKCRS